MFEEFCEIIFRNLVGLFALCSIINLVSKIIYFNVKEIIKKENKENGKSK